MSGSAGEMGKGLARRFIERVQAMFPDAGMSPEEWGVLEQRVAAYEFDSAVVVLGEYRAGCRFRKPVIADLLKALSRAKYGEPQAKQEAEVERAKRLHADTDERLRQERRASEHVHIPALIRLGREEVRRRRDTLLGSMKPAQRNYAGAPTWDELIGLDEMSPRMLVWRYWIITEQLERYEPEVSHV
jgi:hypothetical protein